eukprot:1585239-Pyramimonas_sp.AAC.1
MASITVAATRSSGLAYTSSTTSLKGSNSCSVTRCRLPASPRLRPSYASSSPCITTVVERLAASRSFAVRQKPDDAPEYLTPSKDHLSVDWQELNDLNDLNDLNEQDLDDKASSPTTQTLEEELAKQEETRKLLLSQGGPVPSFVKNLVDGVRTHSYYIYTI